MNEIPSDHPAIKKAAGWLRSQYQIPEFETITKEFEKEFNCEVEFIDQLNISSKVKFANGKDLTFFMLKWS